MKTPKIDLEPIDSALNATKTVDWQPVDKALAESTASGYKIAVIESEKILKNLIAPSAFPCQNYEEKISSVYGIVSDPDELARARKIYREILDKPYYGLSLEDVKTAIAAYYRSSLDLKNSIET